jgi:hypothetical protein
MNLLKTLASLSLLAVAAVSLTACDERDLAFGTGVVVGVIVTDHGNHHHRPPPPRYRRGRRWSSNEAVALSPAETVSMKYNLSLEQAEILTSRLLPAQHGDLSGVASLGFTKQDLEALFVGQNPSAATLKTLSETLSLSLGDAHELIQDIKADALEARASM